MIVFGDAGYEAEADALLRRLRARVSELAASAPTLEALRTLLIQAGRLEQAPADGPAGALPNHTLSLLETVTDYAAAAFEVARRGDMGAAPARPGPSPLHRVVRILGTVPELATTVT